MASYQYLINSSGYVPNPVREVTFANGYNGNTQSATIMFICAIPTFIFLGLWIYRSDPWKEPFFKNKFLLILLILNFILMFFLFFGTQYLSFLDVVAIDNKVTLVCLLFMLGASAISGLFNYIIERQKFHENSTKNSKEMNNKSELLESIKTQP